MTSRLQEELDAIDKIIEGVVALGWSMALPEREEAIEGLIIGTERFIERIQPGCAKAIIGGKQGEPQATANEGEKEDLENDEETGAEGQGEGGRGDDER